MLNRVHFQNIRALAELELSLERFTVLVGPNACGKSTVLDEIEGLCRLSWPQENLYMPAPGSDFGDRERRLRCSGAEGPMTWEGESKGSHVKLCVAAPNDQPWYFRSTFMVV